MDRNALTETRRETVLSLLKGMNIKKNEEGGFQKDDVYNCIQQLCDLYEQHIEELENNYEAEIGELNAKYQKYDENNELYVSLILDAKKISNDIINQAKEEVDQILASCKEKVEEQEALIEQMKIEGANEKARIAAEIAAAQESADAEKAAIRIEMEGERENLEAIKTKYRQQSGTLDELYRDLKTNILLAATKLDGMKAQLEVATPQPDTTWDVNETNSGIAFPAADVEVDNVIDYAVEASETPEIDNASEIETTEEPASFEDTFFKSEILSQIPVAEATEEAPETEEAEEEIAVDENGEPEVEVEIFEEPIEAAPVEEIAEPAETPVIEEAEPAPIEIAVEEIEEIAEPAETPVIEAEPAEEIVLDIAEEAAAPADAELESLLEEISFEDLDQILNEIETDNAAEPAAQAEAAVEEISFEGLEALFKDEQQIITKLVCNDVRGAYVPRTFFVILNTIIFG